MNNESIICTPVMIEATPENHPAYMMFGKPQHLYLVEDRRPKMGEWYFNQDRITQNTLEETNLPTYWKTVVSATHKSLSLPLIPSSFIEEWISKQGKINKARVKIRKNDPWDSVLTKEIELDYDGEVIILPIEDKTFSREEVYRILDRYRVQVAYESTSLPALKKWFDLNY